MKTIKRIFRILLVVILLVAGAAAWLVWGMFISNPHNYKTIGEIPTPMGFERQAPDDFASYLRQLPLQPRGSDVMLCTGEKADGQSLNYAVVDMPLISNYEQCADCCMRLRAEYLFARGQYDRIHFQDVNHNNLEYGGGGSRKALESYLRKLYGVASTYSLVHELPKRKINELSPGDILVFAAPKGRKYGHAIMVVDVAVNKSTGQIALLLAQGATPARSIHVVRNITSPIRSPWYIVDADDEEIFVCGMVFGADNLRYFKN